MPLGEVENRVSCDCEPAKRVWQSRINEAFFWIAALALLARDDGFSEVSSRRLLALVAASIISTIEARRKCVAR